MAYAPTGIRCPLSLIIACIVTLGTVPVAAEVYRWVDEHGQVHYGDRPQRADQQPLQVAPSAQPMDPQLQQRRQRRERLLQIFAEDRERQRVQAQRQAEAEAKRLRACQQARDALRSLEHGGRFYTLDQAGERRYLGDKEIAQRKQHWQGEAQRACAGP